jgi:hypothetical protein
MLCDTHLRLRKLNVCHATTKVLRNWKRERCRVYRGGSQFLTNSLVCRWLSHAHPVSEGAKL